MAMPWILDYDRELRENAKFLEYVESVIQNPDKLKDKPKKIEKFLEKTEVVKDTGEIVDTKTLLSIDRARCRNTRLSSATIRS